MTVRGILLSHFPGSLTSEWNTSPQNRAFPPADTALTEVVAQEGDRLVIEIGFRSFNTDSAQYYYGYFEAGDPLDAFDLPENETETAQKAGWLEFSQALVWRPDPYEVTGSSGVVAGVSGVAAFGAPDTLAVVGAIGVDVEVSGAVDFGSPATLEVVGEVGVLVEVNGVIGFVSPKPKVYKHPGSCAVRVGIQGSVGFVAPQTGTAADLEVVGSVGVAIGVAGVIDGITPPVLAVEGSVGVVVGSFRVPELTVVKFIEPADLTFVAGGKPVAVEVGIAGIIGEFKPGSFAASGFRMDEGVALQVGVAGCIAFITPQVLEVLGEGEVIVGVGVEEEGVFDTYVLTGFRNEPSLYSNFNFNSYARYRGQFYGAKADGVYLLAGEDDAGEEIHAGVRIGPANFGTDREKRLRLLRLGGECGQARVKVGSGNGNAKYFGVEQGIVGVSRDIQGREITIDIMDFESLNHLEIVSKALARR